MSSYFRPLAILALIISFATLQAQQSVSIGTTAIDQDAVLFLLGDGTQGLIIPKTTDLQAMPKKAGMVVYSESDGKVYSCDGNAWTALGGGTTGTTPTLQINGNDLSIFTGTTVPLATTAPTNRGQILMWDGSKWTVNTAADPVTGDILIWNGSRWAPSSNIVTDVTGTAPINVGVGATATTRNVSIATGGIATGHLADGAVTSLKIADGTIADADIATSGITTAGKVSGNAITTGTIGGSTAINTTGNITTTGTLGVSGAATLGNLSGAGTRMVVANATGVLSTQAIPGAAATTDLTTSTTGVTIANGTGAVNGASPVTINIQNATTTQAGLLTAADFTTFNNKQGAITLTTTGTSGAATLVGNTLNIPNYAGTTYVAGTGLTLSGNTFSVNSSQNITTLSNLSSNGLVKTSGGTGALSIATAGIDFQAPLVSGTNIKTINGASVLGAGNIAAVTTELDPTVSAINGIVKSNGTTVSAVVSGTDIKTINGASVLGAGNITAVTTELDPTVKAINGIVKSNGTTISAAVAGTDYLVTETDATVKAINGIVKSNGTTISAATAGTDYQVPLVSGTNIKTINGTSVLGSGNITAVTTELDPTVSAINGIVKSNGTTVSAVVSGTDIKTINGTSVLGSGNITAVTTELDPTVTAINGIVKSNGATVSAVVSGTDIKTINGTSVLGAGNITAVTTETDPTVTAINGLVKSNGTTISAATAGTDYQVPLVSGTNIKTINGASVLGAGNITAVTTETDPSVTAINGLVKSNGTTISAAVAGTDYLAPNGDGSALTNLNAASISSGTLANARLNIGTAANQLVQLDGTGKLPAVDGSQLTNVPVNTAITTNFLPKSNGATFVASTIAENGGAVGIGTVSPQGLLHVSGAGNIGLVNESSNVFGTWQSISNTSAGGQIFSIISTGSGNGEGAGKLLFQRNSGISAVIGNIMTLEHATGNVGIGNVSPAATLDVVGTVKIADGTQGAGKVLTSDASGLASWQAVAGTGTVTSVATGTGLTGGPITSSGTLAVDVGTTANKIVQLDATGKLPAVDGSQLTNLPAGVETDPTVAAINGLVKSNGTTISAATAGTDYQVPLVSGTNIKTINGASVLGTGNITAVTTESDPTVAAINGLVKSNGTTIGAVVSGTDIKTINGTTILGAGNITAVTTEADPTVTAINGLVKSNGTTISAAVAGTDYLVTETDATVKAISGIVKSNGTTISAAVAGTDYVATETDPTVKAINGLVKSNGTTISAAVAGTDYLTTNQTITLSGDVTGSGATAIATTIANGAISGGTAGKIADGTITDADISATAAIAGTKVSPNFGSQTIATTGSVGIGTSTPVEQLSITGTTTMIGLDNTGGGQNWRIVSDTDGTLKFVKTSGTTFPPLTLNGNGAIGIYDGVGSVTYGTAGQVLTSGGPGAVPTWSNAGGLPTGTIGQTLVHDGTNFIATSNLYNDGTNIGIGTTTPTVLLDINPTTGVSSAIIKSNDNSAALTIDADAASFAALDFANNGTGRYGVGLYANDFYIDETGVDRRITVQNTSGFVGIGNIVPSEKLDVDGPIYLRDLVNPPGTINERLYNVGKDLYWDGVQISGGGSGWGLTGTAGTSSATNFIGTTDAQDLKFKVNGQHGGEISQSGGLANTSFGFNAAPSVVASSANSAFGTNALGGVTSGDNNTAMGVNALIANSTGRGNTAVGSTALTSNNGNYNVGFGLGALNLNGTGSFNSAVGTDAMRNTNASGNTAVGFTSMITNTTGTNNTAIGYNADVLTSGLTNATAIGYNAKVGASNSLVLGGTGVDAVNVGIGTTTPHAPLEFASAPGNRKIVFWDIVNNDHQFIGFGLSPNVLRYQTDNSSSDHVFYTGTSSTTSNELMRIMGTGNVGIGTSAPTATLEVAGQVKITGGVPGLGKVLTSDASGLATWQTISGTGTVTSVGAGTGLTGGPITTSGTLAVDVGTTANKIVQLDGTGKLPAVDGSQLTNLPAGAETDPNVKAINGLVKSNGTTISAAVAGTDYLTTNQTITLSGDITGSGTTAITAAIGAGKVTNTMLAGSIASSKLVGTDINTVGTITTGVWNGTKIDEAHGGTNQTAYATGDMLYATAPNVLGKLGIGANGQVLTVTGGVPTWAAATSPFNTNNIVPRGNGTTLVASSIQDDGTTLGIGITPQANIKLDVATSSQSIGLGVDNTRSGAAANYGVYATVQSSTTSNTAVFGSAQTGSNPIGLYGQATGATAVATAVQGMIAFGGNTSPQNIGVEGAVSLTGASSTNYGLKGTASGSGTTNYGVYGTASGATTNWAGYFAGNTAITGALAVGGTPTAGTAGQVLTSAGAGLPPTWAPAAGVADITISIPNTSVAVGNGTGITGTDNVFVGHVAGTSNTGTANTFIGRSAGVANTSGTTNTFIGTSAGSVNSTGQGNVMVGVSSGSGNVGVGHTSGNNNTLLGNDANVGSIGLTNATALGYRSVVGASNSLVLGGTGANAVKVGIGTTTPGSLLDLYGPDNSSLDLTSTAGTNIKLRAAVNSSNAAEIGTVTNHKVNLFTNNLPRLTLDVNGNIGIGATTPLTPLQVGPTFGILEAGGDDILTHGIYFDGSNFINRSTTAGSAVLLGDGKLGMYTFPAGAAAGVTASPDMRFNVKPTGVGIQVDNPVEVFDLNGAAHLRDISATPPADPTHRLYNNAGILYWDGSPLGGGGAFTGANFVPRGNAGGTAQEASTIYDTPTFTGIGTTTQLPGSRLTINGGTGGGYGGMDVNVSGAGARPYYGFGINGTQTAWINQEPNYDMIVWAFDGASNVQQLKLKANGSVAFDGQNPSGVTNFLFGGGGSVTTGNYNIILGNNAGSSLTTGSSNVLLAPGSGTSLTTGDLNVFIGEQAGSLATGSYNTSVGTNSGINAGISHSTAIGADAIATASNSIILGSASDNVGIGTSAPTAKLEVAGQIKITGGTPGVGKVLTSDAAGLATWQSAGGSGWGLTGNATTVDGTNFIGTTDNVPFTIRTNNIRSARIEPAANGNAFFGFEAGLNVPSATGTTAVGYQALRAAAIGSQNTAIGFRAMNATNNAIQNVAVGMNAMLVNTTGSQNTAVGYGALSSNTDGLGNVALGMSSLNANTSGDNNVSLGYQSTFNNLLGNNNVGVGAQSLQNTNADNNVAVGIGAGAFNTTGTNNTYLGFGANATVNSLTNATAVGANATVSQSNSLILGNSANVGIGTSTPNGFPGRLVHLAGTGNTAYILEKTDATARKWAMVTGSTGEYIVQDMTGSVNAFAIAPGGNVGIGTTAPGALLDLNSAFNGMRINGWFSSGASIGGAAYVGTNLYRNFSDNVWKYTNTHGSIGGAAIQFNGIGGAGTENDILFLSTTIPGTANANATVSESMRIKGGTGYVGIGTSSPVVPLDINLSTSYFDPSLTFFNDGNGGGLSVNESQNPLISVRAFGGFLSSGTGLGGGFYVISDERIKRKVSVSDSRNDLSTLMKLKVTDYKFVDSLRTGDAQVKGVFAQEVETVYPQAISKQTNFIPNVYAMANGLEYDAANHKLSITLTKPHGLVVGDKVKLISSTSGEKPAVVSAVKDNTFTVSDWTEKSEKVFVYGKEVNDFRIVDYDRLFTLNISATQELNKKLEAEIAKNKEQNAQIEFLKAELEKATTKGIKRDDKVDNTTVEARLNALTAELEKLKTMLGAEAKKDK